MKEREVKVGMIVLGSGVMIKGSNNVLDRLIRKNDV